MPDPHDLRAARLAATPMGEQVHDRVRAQRTRVLSARLEQLPAETAETLLAAVPAMEALAEAVKPAHRTAR
jgi:DNA-binding MarR family transcriptional regulator